METIMKSRNQGRNNTKVLAPVYDAPFDTPFDLVNSFPVRNLIPSEISEDVRSISKDNFEYEDIQGWELTMLTRANDSVFRNQVKVIGRTSTHYIVRFMDDDETEYSIRANFVKFVNPQKE